MNRPNVEDYRIIGGWDDDKYTDDLENYCDEIERINKIYHDKEEKYKWHDLKKDPNDLPKEEGVYLVKVGACFPYRAMEYKPSNYGYGIDNPKANLWKDFGTCGDYVYNHFVKAWKYIEEFKD